MMFVLAVDRVSMRIWDISEAYFFKSGPVQPQLGRVFLLHVLPDSLKVQFGAFGRSDVGVNPPNVKEPD